MAEDEIETWLKAIESTQNDSPAGLRIVHDKIRVSLE